MSKRRHVARGFTLLELMVVVAIIGVLATVAIPSYQRFQLRAKQAERGIMVTSVVRAVDDMWIRESRYPIDLGDGNSELYLNYTQPDASPGISKRPWRTRPLNSWDHWARLSLMVEGGVYYSYYGMAYDYTSTGGYRYFYIYTLGDLDGDHVQNQQVQYWYYQNNQLAPFGGSNTSCATARCSYAYDYTPNTF